jgi:MoCo/4Fe-4S cofactor protein with predicted Tat translocation signal
MTENKKTYWKGLEELTNDESVIRNAEREFPEGPSTLDGSSRRDFLKMMGFSLAAASLAACEAPVRKAIPYVNKPVDINPSIPNYYASTFASGGDYASIVVKTREGRPIKIDGNELSPISQGGTSAIVEASVLSLYDKQRLAGPLVNGEQVEWSALDAQVKSQLASAGTVKIVTNTILSPATDKVLQQFAGAFGGAEIITYDPISSYGITQAAEMTYGSAMLPTYHFDKASVIVSFAADFLGTWISPIEFAKQYSKTRKISKDKPVMSRHFQFESNLSLTGANADYRTPIKASQTGLAVIALYNALAKKAGGATLTGAAVDVQYLDKAANELWANRGKSIVVAGSNDPNVQIVINAINDLLENNGVTVDFSTPSYFRKGNDAKMNQFVADLKAGKVGGVVFYNCNPVYDFIKGAELAEAIAKAKVSIATNGTLDETASLVKIVAPDHHYLESWNDFNPRKGHYSLSQPVISPLFNTRQAQDSFLTWSGSDSNYYDFLQDSWKSTLFTTQSETASFQEFWDRTLFNGVYALETSSTVVSGSADLAAAASGISKVYKSDNSGTELVVYTKVGIGSGAFANIPWLQEMSDPISKATWDNYLTVSQSWRQSKG